MVDDVIAIKAIMVAVKPIIGILEPTSDPKTIAAQTLDYGSIGEIQKLNVTFSYRWWKS